MIQPEEDFATWQMIIKSTADSIEDFQIFIPDITRLIQTIETTDELPEIIKDQKTEFIKLVTKTIIPCVLRMRQLTPEFCERILNFLKTVISFGFYGIRKNQDQPASIFEKIFEQKPSLFSNNSQFDFYDKLISYLQEIQIKDACIQSIQSEDTTIPIIQVDFIILSALNTNKESVIINPGDFWSLSELIVKSLTSIMNNEKRSKQAPTSNIFNLFESIRKKATTLETINEKYVFDWLDCIKLFVVTDIFDKQYNGLKAISYFISEAKTMISTLKWFETNPQNIFDCLSAKNLHTEFIPNYQLILSELAASSILPDNYIDDLWEYHKVQYSTQLLQFFSIFVSIAARLNVDKIQHLVTLCVKPDEITEAWLTFMGQLGETIGKRNDDKDSFLLIRDSIFPIAFPQPSPEQETEEQKAAKEKLTLTARDSLILILQYYLTPEELVNFSQQLGHKCNNPLLFFQLMVQPVSSTALENEGYCKELLTRSIDYLNDNAEGHKTIYTFIYNLCLKNSIKIPDDLASDLFTHSDDADFYNFAVSVVNSDLISFDFIESFILGKTDKITADFAMLVSAFIYKLNDYTNQLTHLPIVGDSILWKLATTDSPQRTDFSNMLTQMYASNDGVQLSDKAVITDFINSWSQKFNQSRSVTNDETDVGRNYTSYMLQVMKTFLTQIEDSIDISLFYITRHDPSYSSKLIKVTITSMNLPANQTHMFPENTRMSAIKNRVARTAMISPNTFHLIYSQNPVKENLILRNLAGPREELNLAVRILEPEKFLPFKHERTCVPSVILMQNEQMTDTLITLLKENITEAKSLLEYLPTIPSTILEINEIQKKNSFDYKELLPVEYPLLFEYNFESLTNSYNKEFAESFERTHGFEYLADTLNPSLYQKVLPFISKNIPLELKQNLSQKLFDKIYPSLFEQSTIDDPTLFGLVKNFINEIALLMFPEHKLVLNENQYPTIDKIIFGDVTALNELVQSILDYLEIPLSAFMVYLEKANDQFYTALLPHITEFNQQLYDKIDINSVPLLSILDKFLELNVVPEQDKEKLTSDLIKRYLEIESPTRTVKQFVEASKCLAQLRNDILLHHLQKLHTNKSYYMSWRIDGDSKTVSETGFSGLVNLGATCFLNSTLQQFFAIPPLRKAIIEYTGNDAFMSQLRDLYAKMLISKGRSVTTEALVNEWVGWDGEKMNPRLQQDASEFVQMLIDKLETGLGRDFTNGLFGGTTVDTIEGISEEYHATRNQPFSTYQLPVQGYTNFDQAIQAVPDFFTGNNQYYADDLKKKIDAKKWQSIGKVPPYLIIVLSRFSYNYQCGERIKIDDPFEFPVDLDLTSHSCFKNQKLKFKLKGVIMHSGTANYGHYISYVNDRKSGKWLCCNDSHVSYIEEETVLQNAYGSKSMSGYLLFYDREDTTSDYEPEISDETRINIDKENRLNDEYCLFCSTGYFDLMTSLSTDKINNDYFSMIPCQYYFDTLPSTSFINFKATTFSMQVVNRLKESENLRTMFTKFINADSSPYLCSLALCPQTSIRKTAYRMLKMMDYVSVSLVQRLYNELETILPYYQVFNEYFSFFYHISKTQHDLLTKKFGLDKIFPEFITTRIPAYQKQKSEIRQEYFYSNMDLTGIFKAIASIGIDPSIFDEVQNAVLNDASFKNIFITSTKNKAINQLLDYIDNYENSKNVNEYITNEFIPHSGILVDFYRFSRFMFDRFGVKAIDILSKNRFKTKSGPMDEVDLAMAILGQVSISPEFKKALLHDLRPIFKLLVSGKPDCRITAQYIIAFLVPSYKFTTLFSLPSIASNRHFVMAYKSILFFPAYYDSDEEDIKQNKPTQSGIKTLDELNKIKEEVHQNAQIVYQAIKDNEQEIVQYIKENEQASGSYLATVIDKLDVENDSEFLLQFAKNIGVKKAADQFRKDIINLILPKKPELITDDFILESLGDITDESQQGLFARTVFFLQSFEPILDRFNPPVEFVKTFVEQIAFSKSPHSTMKYETTAKFIECLAKLHPEVFLDFIKSDFDRIVFKNFSSLLITLRTTNEKMDILKHLKTATSQKQFFTLSELVTTTLKYNNGDIPDVIDLVSFLNNPELSTEARSSIWNLIDEKKPSYTSFKSVFKWKGDYFYLSRYLLSICSTENNDNQDHINSSIYECAMNSIESLMISFDYLKEKMPEMIRNEEFVHPIFKLNFDPEKHEEEFLEKFVLFITENKNEESINSLLKPLVAKINNISKFVSDVLDDPIDDAISKPDILPIIVPLRVMSKLQIGMHPLLVNLGKLKYMISSEKATNIKFPEFVEFCQLVKKAILV